MVQTLPSIDSIHNEEKVNAISINSSGDKVLIGDCKGNVSLYSLSQDGQHLENTFIFSSSIIDVIWHNEKFLVIDEVEGVHMYNQNGEVQWKFNLEAGGSKAHIQQQIAILDGIGTLRFLTFDGKEHPEIYRQIISFEPLNDGFLLLTEQSQVKKINSSFEEVFSREQRGDIGEDIVFYGHGLNSTWFVAREGHALVPGDEEALEIEFFSGKERVSRSEIPGRIRASSTRGRIQYLGLDNGSIVHVSNEFELAQVHQFPYAIRCLELTEKHLLVGTWFNIYAINLVSNEIDWTIEHKGLVEQIITDKNQTLMLFFGEDQNDWTDAEPVGICNIHQQPVEVDDSFLQGWFEKEVFIAETNPEVVYRNVDDFESLLSDGEREMLTDSERIEEFAFDALSDALNEISQSIEDIDEEEGEDLLSMLHESSEMFIPPSAYAGDDQTYVLETGDLSMILTLDASNTKDPQNNVVRWSWLDATGKEIATSQKVKVKLPIGTHQFELRVEASDGVLTTDYIQITVLSSDS
jgi:PAS domain-containing protein